MTTAKAQSGLTQEKLIIDVERVRTDFPILQQQVNGHPLVYLDSAATAQKPRCVIDALTHYYTHDNANIHRGVHALSVRATQGYELTRHKVQSLINAPRVAEIVFGRSATEMINLVASTFVQSLVKQDDEIIISAMEHHSNIVPWQMLCERTGTRLRVAPMNDRGDLLVEEYARLFNSRTRFVALAHVSNALGTINPVHDMIRIAHEHGAYVLLDGAQAVPHMPVDVQALDCDFYAFSSHKMYGPTGVGVLYGRYALLDRMPPYQGGGEMIKSVAFDKTTYNDAPHKFEAGTPDIANVIAFSSAIDYLTELGMDRIAAYEHDLLEYANGVLSSIPAVRIIGTAKAKAAVISFVIDGVHAHDVGTILDQRGIAVRTGHHCAQPVMDFFGVPATARASLGIYNTREEIDKLARGITEVVEVFS